MKRELTSEMFEKLKAAKSVLELLSIAKKNGAELSQEDAEAYYARLNQSGALSDDELDLVSGGILTKTTIKTDLSRSTGVIGGRCPYCGSDSPITYDSGAMIRHVQTDHPEKYSEFIEKF